MSKEKIIAIKIFINLLFIGFISSMIFTLFNHNKEKDYMYVSRINNLTKSLNESQLTNIKNDIKDNIELFNSSLENDIKLEMSKEDFMSEYKDSPNIYSDLFHIIKKNVSKFELKKNTVMIGTKDNILYNNSLDEYNVYKWNNFIDNETLIDLMSGNLNSIYIKTENDETFTMVDEEEVIDVIMKSPEELYKYNLFIPSQITNYGDIIGNSDILFNDKNVVSEYKILILYRENMKDIYNSSIYGFNISNNLTFSHYYDYILITIGIIIWFIYVITLDKTNEVIKKIKSILKKINK